MRRNGALERDYKGSQLLLLRGTAVASTWYDSTTAAVRGTTHDAAVSTQLSQSTNTEYLVPGKVGGI